MPFLQGVVTTAVTMFVCCFSCEYKSLCRLAPHEFQRICPRMLVSSFVSSNGSVHSHVISCTLCEFKLQCQLTRHELHLFGV